MLVRYALSDYIQEALTISNIEQLEDGSYVAKIPSDNQIRNILGLAE